MYIHQLKMKSVFAVSKIHHVPMNLRHSLVNFAAGPETSAADLMGFHQWLDDLLEAPRHGRWNRIFLVGFRHGISPFLSGFRWFKPLTINIHGEVLDT